jgi:hypothetical protein
VSRFCSSYGSSWREHMYSDGARPARGWCRLCTDHLTLANGNSAPAEMLEPNLPRRHAGGERRRVAPTASRGSRKSIDPRWGMLARGSSVTSRNAGRMCGYQPPAVPCATGSLKLIALASADNMEEKEHTILDNASLRGNHTRPITPRSTRVHNART